MIKKIRYTVLFLLLISFALISCKSAEPKDSYIKIEVHEQQTGSGKVIQIPEFVSNNEEIHKNLRDLDKEINELKKDIEKAQKKGTEAEMRCYVGGTDNYPQATVVWYVDEEESRLYNLVTLAADTQEGLPIDCKEALLRTQMSGVDLSLEVGKLFNESLEKGKLQSTEMQGFKLGEDGEVKEIYMKLTLVREEEEEKIIEEHFFSYVPGTEELVPLSEKGFDIP